MQYRLTGKGRDVARGIISAICYGHDLETVAALNGLDDADSVRIILWMVSADAGLAEPVELDSDEEGMLE